MESSFIVKAKDNGYVYAPVQMVEPTSLKVFGNTLRRSILELLAKKPMYPAELAAKLKVHEQNIYYHLRQMQQAGLLDIAEKKEIRGTIAKKYKPTALSFAVSLGGTWKEYTALSAEANRHLLQFLSPVVQDALLQCLFVVGSPDPHGPFKAYARDGHYAIELALFLGHYYSQPPSFGVKLDVDLKREKQEKENLILVGGPVTNTIVSEVNAFLPVSFGDKEPWTLLSKKTGRKYTDDSIGIVAKIPNPWDAQKCVLVLAGIRGEGTRAAILALTRFNNKLLQRYTEQKEWACVVQGYDIDGDGVVDSVEVVE
ncbi:helix-turn-helix domain-containing protein [Candidatus Woesearchaeota archaeon]|nr:helix-turn-helix domain-containing protein [Candidatus Woesearchaeota archaeon]